MRVQPSNILFSSKASLVFDGIAVKIQLDRSRSIQTSDRHSCPSIFVPEIVEHLKKRYGSLRLNSIREHNSFLEDISLQFHIPEI